MKASINYALSLGAWLLSGCLLLIPMAAAQNIGTVVMARGDVTAENAAGETRALSRRSEVLVGDLLATGPEARLQIRMIDNALIDLRPGTALRMEVYQGESPNAEDRVLMDLVNGTLSTLTGTFGRSRDDAYEVRAASASIGIRGTSYGVLNDPNNNSVFTTVTNGVINLSSPNGDILLGPTQPFRNGRIIGNQAPQGLLLPPQELLDALLSGNDDNGEEEGEGDGESGQDVAGSPPVEGDLDDPVRDNESVTGTTLATANLQQTQPSIVDNQLTVIERRLSVREQNSIAQSDRMIFSVGDFFGNGQESIQGVLSLNYQVVDGEVIPEGLIAIYDGGIPSFSNGYSIANTIIRPNVDATGDQDTFVWFKNPIEIPGFNNEPPDQILSTSDYSDQYENFPEGVSRDPDVSWGYWDVDPGQSVANIYQNYESTNPTGTAGDDRIWYVAGTPDRNIDWNETTHSFGTELIYGSDSNGANISHGSFDMKINNAGIVMEANLFVDIVNGGYWDMVNTGNPAVINGTLDMPMKDDGSTYVDATGSINGLFSQDNSGDKWFFGTYDLQSVSGDTVNGVIVSPEGSVPQ